MAGVARWGASRWLARHSNGLCAGPVAVLGLVVTLSLAAPPVSGGEGPGKLTQEYYLKAAFLFNFAHFVEWPRQAFESATAPMVIGILGNDPFGESLDELVSHESVHDRPLVVRRYRSVDEIDSCHILFISQSESSRLDRILAALAHRSVLTVGETRDFAARSGIIAFELRQQRLRLQINVPAARAAKLTISSMLLRQSQLVGAKRIEE
jgi:hypothetical protein